MDHVGPAPDDAAYSTTYDDDPAWSPAAQDAPSSWSRNTAGHVPGEVGIWVFIFGDMLAFATFFGVFVYERGSDPMAFEASRSDLTVAFAVANTLLLLTSSLFVAMAVRAVRTARRHLAPPLLVAAAICGALFVVNKGIEYTEQFRAGVDPGTNDFFMYFFMLTGIHLLHVAIGLVVLGILWQATCRPVAGPDERRTVETGASYWHMVDLLWIVLFPLLYLVR